MGTRSGKRILFVLDYYPPHLGGVEVLFGQVAEALVGQGHHVSVVTNMVAGAPARENRNGVDVYRIATPRIGARYWFTLLALPTVLRLAADADLVHTTTYTAAIPGWLGARLRGKPVVITVHEVFAEQWQNLPGLSPLVGLGFRAFEWGVLTLPFDRYVADSEFSRGRLVSRIRVRPVRTSVAYPPVDYGFWDRRRHGPRVNLRAELGMGEGDPLYLYFGRPGVSKGVEYLVEAAASIARDLPRSRLLMLLSRAPADGYARVTRQIDRLGLRDHVIVKDPVPRTELPGYLLGSDCVVVPSVSEGFGYSAVEAATLGCRVVATTGHSVQEVVGDAVTLVPPRKPVALAAVVTAALVTRPPVVLPGRTYTLPGHLAALTECYAGVLGRAPFLQAPDAQAA